MQLSHRPRLDEPGSQPFPAVECLVAEHRTEGTALTDEGAELSDVPLPAEGTESHATLLVAEHLAGHMALHPDGAGPAAIPLPQIAAFLAQARDTHGRLWRRSAREDGGEHELAAQAVQRLLRLDLVRRSGAAILPLPALARYRLGALPVQLAQPVQASLL